MLKLIRQIHWSIYIYIFIVSANVWVCYCVRIFQFRLDNGSMVLSGILTYRILAKVRRFVCLIKVVKKRKFAAQNLFSWRILPSNPIWLPFDIVRITIKQHTKFIILDILMIIFFHVSRIGYTKRNMHIFRQIYSYSTPRNLITVQPTTITDKKQVQSKASASNFVATSSSASVVIRCCCCYLVLTHRTKHIERNQYLFFSPHFIIM